jgi:L-2-hydroxyglutarate oxidase
MDLAIVDLWPGSADESGVSRDVRLFTELMGSQSAHFGNANAGLESAGLPNAVPRDCSVAIIGGGIVGLATAYKLASRPGFEVTVLEKEAEVGRHQSGNNSGVMHAGLYYEPGSLKARLAVSGIRQLRAFCEEHSIPHETCGKLVVATETRELPLLKNLMDRGQRNGLEGLRWLGPEQLSEIEPHAKGLAAVQVPEEGIVDYPKVCSRLSDLLRRSGGTVVTGAQVTALKQVNSGWRTETTAGSFESRVIVNCAGLHADRVAKLAGETCGLKIIPFRGQYYKLKADRERLVRNLIYPVPDPAFPFLGVHFTRMIRGGIEAGPNASLAFAREGYRKSTINLRDLAEASTYSGLWRFVGRYPSACRDELGKTMSRKLFCRALQKLVPEVQPDDLVRANAGVRAQAILPDGRMVNDFYFRERPGALHVLNAPSPAATASLSIADEIVRRLASQFS